MAAVASGALSHRSPGRWRLQEMRESVLLKQPMHGADQFRAGRGSDRSTNGKVPAFAGCAPLPHFAKASDVTRRPMNPNLNNAIQIRIIDKAVQAYLQQYPFGFGREPAMHRTALVNLRQGLQVRPEVGNGETALADPSKHGLAPDEMQRTQRLFVRLRVPGTQQQWAWEVLAWKTAHIPRSSRTVLSIGCGGGVELILIRALLPEAKIAAVDFQDHMPRPVKAALDVRFVRGHFNDFLAQHLESFDAVFCHHVLEHLYEPELTLRLILRCLKPNGSLIAGLPMEGCADGVFAGAMRRIVSNPRALHPLDIGILDAGHAWKTHPADLRATLEKEGF